MRLVLSWLKEFVDLPASAQEIAETIGQSGRDGREPHARVCVRRRQRDRPAERRRHFAGEAEDAEAVGPVRRDLEIDHGVAAAEMLD